MKKITAILVTATITLFFFCSSTNEKMGNFKILPLPQHLLITGVSNIEVKDILSYHSTSKDELPVLSEILKHIKASTSKGDSELVYSIDNTLDVSAEGYTLVITKAQITITGKDKAGLFYGFKTLEQIMEDAQEQEVSLPLCRITDFPLLSYRAVHLDLKHHIEKTTYYYSLIDKLASYKVNAIIAEMEDKLAFEKHPIIGSSDALSISEWKKISDYANERHIEISPLTQGLGHASFILKHSKYKHLRDTPESDWAFDPLNPETYEVQYDLYLEAMEATPHGKYLHIGGDEVNTTGRNSGKTAMELQLIWLKKVCAFAEKHGRTPIFWDDMPLKHSNVYKPMFQPKLTQEQVDALWEENEHRLWAFLDDFPKNCIYMRWNYTSPEALGNIKAMEWFRSHDLQVMGATAGQTRWPLMPLEESNMENIKNFAVGSINSDLNGLLLTLWDDDSPHFELYIRGIIAFSEYVWSGEKRNKTTLKSAYRQREFSYLVADSSYAFIDDLEKAVAFWKNALLKGNKRNYLKTMTNSMEEGIIDFPNKNNKGQWSKHYASRLEKALMHVQIGDSIAVKIADIKAKAIRNTYTLEVYEQVNQLTRFASKTLLLLADYDIATTAEEEQKAIQQLHNLRKDFNILRTQFEKVYSKTRILTKPDNYILDQDHHFHLANQSLNFDWQFLAEMQFLDKMDKELF